MGNALSRIGLFVLGSVVFACAPVRTHYPAANPALPFSSAVLVGDTLYISGHLGLEPGVEPRRPPADPAEEARIMLDGFEKSVVQAGLTMDDLVAVQVFCSDTELYGVFNAEYQKRFTGPFPSRAFVGSGELLFGCRFEMLGTAVAR